MLTDREKLAQDLHVLAEMVAQLDPYLAQEKLFWQMRQPGLPALTIGGCLMRQHRLLALPHLLTGEERLRLHTAVTQFNAVLVEKVVRFEQKTQTEIEARTRQWREYLNEAEWKRNPTYNAYPTAVEARLMLTLLTNKLQEKPYHLPEEALPHMQQLDALLQSQWRAGEFVWFDSWEPAYPRDRFWWLYGRPE